MNDDPLVQEILDTEQLRDAAHASGKLKEAAELDAYIAQLHCSLESRIESVTQVKYTRL